MKKIIFILLTLISFNLYSQICPTTTIGNFVRTTTCSLTVTGFGSGIAVINPTLNLGNNLSIVGSITNGTWSGSIIDQTHGGTGYSTLTAALMSIGGMFTMDTISLYNQIQTRAKTSVVNDSISAMRINVNTKMNISTAQDSIDMLETLISTKLSSETDPLVGSHIKSITNTNITNWNSAYSFGNHSGLYLFLSDTNLFSRKSYLSVALLNFYTKSQSDSRYLQSFTELDPIYKADSNLYTRKTFLTTTLLGYTSLSGNYSNPSWINSLAYSKLTGAPIIYSFTGIDKQLTLGNGTYKLDDYYNTVSVAGGVGVAIFYLTSDKTSTGTALYTTLDYVNPFVNDATTNYSYGYSYNSGTKALSVTTNRAVGVTILSINVLGIPTAVPNGTSIQVLVKGH